MAGLDIRYQVFVSSTYQDLQEERAEVMQALLELDCMPAGMELFPAASEEQWRWIRRVIDESDYYVVIIGGKYGSVHPETGQSYTEMEYRYAIENGKPVIGFIVDKSINLPENRIEIDAERRENLEKFKALVQTKLCKFWENTNDLGAKVSRSITQLIKREPETGWVRADALVGRANEQVLRLQNQILELERTLAASRVSSEGGSDDLARGDDRTELAFTIFDMVTTIDSDGTRPNQERRLGTIQICTTWNEIAAAIAPEILGGAGRSGVIAHLANFYRDRLTKQAHSSPINLTGDERFRVTTQSADVLRTQFVALGLITVEFELSRALGTSRSERWVPTVEGRRYFGRQGAVKR
jgi:hypothetical protein